MPELESKSSPRYATKKRILTVTFLTRKRENEKEDLNSDILTRKRAQQNCWYWYIREPINQLKQNTKYISPPRAVMPKASCHIT